MSTVFGNMLQMQRYFPVWLTAINVVIFVCVFIRYLNQPRSPYASFYDSGIDHGVSRIVVRDYRELNADCAHYQVMLAQKSEQVTLLQNTLRVKEREGVKVSANVPHLNFEAKTLPVTVGQEKAVGDNFQVPNIVHYIWYNTNPTPLQFHHMISVLSAFKFIRPDAIYFHTNNPPTGKYWETVKRIPVLKIRYRSPPTSLFGEKVKAPAYYTSHSNVDRLKVLMEYGGIYLDFDVFATRSFHDLRKFACTIGFESEEKSCGSVIVASNQSFFLYLWINSYLDDYRVDEWAYNTGQVPFNLANRYPHLVHVERTKINRPNFMELEYIYGNKSFNWRDNYALHTWYRLWKDWSGMFVNGTVEPNEDNVKTLNNTFGQIVRDVLYNTTQLIHS